MGAWAGALASSVGPTRLWDTLALPPRNDYSHSTDSKEFYYVAAREISILLQSEQHHILAPSRRNMVKFHTEPIMILTPKRHHLYPNILEPMILIQYSITPWNEEPARV